MSVLYLLIIVGILVAGGFLAAFVWAVRSGQYDDDYTPSVRILFDRENDDDENDTGKSRKKESNSKAESKIKNQNT